MTTLILKKRQKLILKELENAKRPMSAKELADRFSVSLRTIRYDIDMLHDYVTASGGKLVRLPGVGIWLENTGSLARSPKLRLADFISFSPSAREFLLVYIFAMQKGYLSSDYLAGILDISKSTVINEIKQINERIKKHHIEIVGRRKYGYSLIGTEANIFSYFALNNDRSGQEIGSLDLTAQKELLSVLNNYEPNPETILRQITDRLHCIILDVENFSFLFLYLLNRNKIILNIHEESGSYPHAFNLVEKAIGEHIFPELYPMFTYVLNRYTDYLAISDNNSIVESAVNLFLDKLEIEFPNLVSERLQLKTDIMIHLRSTLNMLEVGIREKNPMLSQIRVQFYDIYQAVEKHINILGRAHDIHIGPDEIGYLALYFAKSLEKHSEISDANVVIVCNTGRGAAKLLSSRIMNKLPEVHILGIGSYNILEENKQLKDSIDLIISTMPIESDIPSVVVSPLLNDQELLEIREALYAIRRKHSSWSHPQENDTQKAVQHLGHLNNINTLMAAEISLETVQLYDQLKVHSESLNRLAGLLTHVLMSVPRWFDHRFIQTQDYDLFMKKYPFQMRIILDYLKKIEQIIKEPIPAYEAVALLRYIL